MNGQWTLVIASCILTVQRLTDSKRSSVPSQFIHSSARWLLRTVLVVQRQQSVRCVCVCADNSYRTRWGDLWRSRMHLTCWDLWLFTRDQRPETKNKSFRNWTQLWPRPRTLVLISQDCILLNVWTELQFSYTSYTVAHVSSSSWKYDNGELITGAFTADTIGFVSRSFALLSVRLATIFP